MLNIEDGAVNYLLTENILGGDCTESIPTVVFGNKMDLATEEVVVKPEEGRDYAGQFNCHHFETSVTRLFNLEQALDQLAELILARSPAK